MRFDEDKTSQKSKNIMLLLGIGVFIVGIKMAFSAWCIDEEYAFTMAFRFLKGDLPIKEMWELHQTSMFPMVFLEWIYYKLTGGMSQVAIFVHLITLLIHAIVMFYFFITLKKTYNHWLVFLLSALLFLSIPKLALIPDYSLVMCWGIIITSINFHELCLIDKWHWYRPFLLGFGLVMVVFSYPTTIPVAIILIGILLVNSNRKIKEILFIILSPVILGGIYILYIFHINSFQEFAFGVRMIFSDTSHQVTFWDKMKMYLECTKDIFSYSLPCLLIAFIVTIVAALALYFIRKQENAKMLKSTAFLPCLFFFFLIVSIMGKQIYVWIFEDSYPNYPSVEYIVITIITLILYFKVLITKKIKFYSKESAFVIFPVACYFAILVGSNQNYLVSALFLMPTCVGGMLIWDSIYNKKEKSNKIMQTLVLVLLCIWCMLLSFGRLYFIRADGGRHNTILSGAYKVKDGPAKNLYISHYDGKFYSGVYNEWMEHVPTDMTTYLISNSPIYYMFFDDIDNSEYQISTPSTISTPDYNEILTMYWETNNSKKPECIVWDRVVDVYEISEVLPQLLEKEYTIIYQGDFICIYQRNDL